MKTPHPESSVFLIDGHAYIFRAYFAIRSMKTREGLPGNAAYGFFSTLIKFLQEKKPRHAAITFDFDVKNSFRQDIDPDYKAQRDEADEDLKRQFSWCIEGAKKMGFPTFMKRGYEADDLIGSIVRTVEANESTFVVVSPDKDLGQLVGDRVVQWDLAKDKWIDTEAIEARWGVGPSKLADLFGLIGDSVDNIPGVKGIGPKTASALLRPYERLDDIPRDPTQAKDLTAAARRRAGALLHDQWEKAIRSRDLATIRCDVASAEKLEDLTFRPDPESFATLAQELGFEGLSRRAEEAMRAMTSS